MYIDLISFTQLQQHVTASIDKISFTYNIHAVAIQLLHILQDQLLVRSSCKRQTSHHNMQYRILHIHIRVYKAKLVHEKWDNLCATNVILLLKS